MLLVSFDTFPGAVCTALDTVDQRQGGGCGPQALTQSTSRPTLSEGTESKDRGTQKLFQQKGVAEVDLPGVVLSLQTYHTPT